MELRRYQTIILDVDGVIFDSNTFKEQHILKAALQYTDAETAHRFVEYFTGLNGIPREQKIREFFRETPETGERILILYNSLNENGLGGIAMTHGAFDFIKDASAHCALLALSGGAETEIKKLFELNGLTPYFHKIMGGPKTKVEHLAEIALTRPVLFIGDSKVDYEAAMRIEADFVFMGQYSKFGDRVEYFKGKKIIQIDNFLDFIMNVL